MTENQIVAALMTISVLLGFWFIGHLVTFQNSYTMAFLLSHLSFQTHFGEFVRGLLRSESVIYYSLIITGCLFLNAQYFDWRR